jgi:hypothetical protein
MKLASTGSGSSVPCSTKALTRISRMAGIVLARISEIWSDFQQLAASSVAAPWNTQRVNQITGPCGSILTAA